MSRRKKREPRRSNRLRPPQLPPPSVPGWGGVAIFLALMLLPSVAGVFFTYGSVHLTCTRATANEVARCTGGASGYDGTELRPFALTPNAIQYGESIGHKGYRTAFITTAGGTLKGAALRPTTAHRMVSGAETFRTSPAQLEWHDEETSRTLPLLSIGFGAVIIAFVLWAIYRPKKS